MEADDVVWKLIWCEECLAECWEDTSPLIWAGRAESRCGVRRRANRGGDMTSSDITTRQAEKIYEALRPTLGFLTQLEGRLAELGFSMTDSYFQKVTAARDAFQRLTVESHELSQSVAAVGSRPNRSSNAPQ